MTNRAVWRIVHILRKNTTQEGLIVSDSRVVRIDGHVAYAIGLVNS